MSLLLAMAAGSVPGMAKTQEVARCPAPVTLAQLLARQRSVRLDARRQARPGRHARTSRRGLPRDRRHLPYATAAMRHPDWHLLLPERDETARPVRVRAQPVEVSDPQRQSGLLARSVHAFARLFSRHDT